MNYKPKWTRSKMTVEIANRKLVAISAQIKGLHYFGISIELYFSGIVALFHIFRLNLD